METPDSLNLFYKKISFDIFCPNATIAEYLCYYHTKNSDASYWTDVKVDGKKFSCTSRFRDLYSVKNMCESMYKSGLHNLAELFRIEFNPEEYPISYVKAHIRYQYPGMAKYVYDRLNSAKNGQEEKSINNENLFDLILEDSDTIGISCRNWDGVNSLSGVFISYDNEFTGRIMADERIKEIIKINNNDDRLERSTSSLITSICIMTMFIGLISQCS